MTIPPDTKDWTWVLRQPCPECGYDASTVSPQEVSARLKKCASAWVGVLGREDVKLRPAPTVWSPLEYACHVRDVCRLYLERLELMLTTDDPMYPNWDQDATAVEERYGEQSPITVTEQLAGAASLLAYRFAAVTDDEWQRPGRRSDGASFTVDSFARYFLHDVEHHLHDVSG